VRRAPPRSRGSCLNPSVCVPGSCSWRLRASECAWRPLRYCHVAAAARAISLRRHDVEPEVEAVEVREHFVELGLAPRDLDGARADRVVLSPKGSISRSAALAASVAPVAPFGPSAAATLATTRDTATPKMRRLVEAMVLDVMPGILRSRDPSNVAPAGTLAPSETAVRSIAAETDTGWCRFVPGKSRARSSTGATGGWRPRRQRRPRVRGVSEAGRGGGACPKPQHRTERYLGHAPDLARSRSGSGRLRVASGDDPPEASRAQPRRASPAQRTRARDQWKPKALS
jgi:hypothetical protein